LLARAAHSVGEQSVSLHEAKQDLQGLFEEYERIVAMLEQIEQDVARLLGEIPLANQLRFIKGLGTIYIAAILSGAGDLKQYAHGRQLLRKAGLDLAESKSRMRTGQINLSKRGDAALRKYLYMATLTLVGTNPLFRHLHENNVQVKNMSKRQSVFKLIRKLARILVGMVQHDELFTPEKAVQMNAAFQADSVGSIPIIRFDY
jgi:transposase